MSWARSGPVLRGRQVVRHTAPEGHAGRAGASSRSHSLRCGRVPGIEEHAVGARGQAAERRRADGVGVMLHFRTLDQIGEQCLQSGSQPGATASTAHQDARRPRPDAGVAPTAPGWHQANLVGR
jgi:hypothetical protein